MKKEFLLLAGIILLGILLRILHWSPSPDGDEARYINHAVAISELGTPPYFDPPVAVRVPYLLFLGLWGKAFGYATPQLQASGLFLYALLALLLFQLAKKLYDSGVALTSVLLFSFFPIHILLSTHALTDDLGFVFALSATLVWIWSWNVNSRALQIALWIVGGFAGGLATAIRQPFFLLGVILPLSALIQGRAFLRTMLATMLFALGAACYFVVEGAIFWAWLGDPLFRIGQDLLGSTSLMDAAETAARSVPRKPSSLLQKLFYFRGYFGRLQPMGSFGLVPVLWVLAAIDRISKRDNRSTLVLVFCLVLLFYYFWGTTSLRSWSIPPVNPRYLIPIFSVGTIVVAAFLVALHRCYGFAKPVVILAVLAWAVLSLWICAYGSRPNCTAEFIKHLSAVYGEDRDGVAIPESVLRCFLPLDHWHHVRGMRVVPDHQLSAIEKMDLSGIKAVAVPNETFYSYKHIGVNNALERTAGWWEKVEVVGEKWPKYLKLTGKPSARIIGHVYIYKGDHNR